MPGAKNAMYRNKATITRGASLLLGQLLKSHTLCNAPCSGMRLSDPEPNAKEATVVVMQASVTSACSLCTLHTVVPLKSIVKLLYDVPLTYSPPRLHVPLKDTLESVLISAQNPHCEFATHAPHDVKSHEPLEYRGTARGL